MKHDVCVVLPTLNEAANLEVLIPRVKAVFAEMGVPPDFAHRGAYGPAKLASIHRLVDGADIYFVSNQKYSAAESECAFRVSGKVPELWHPDTGQMEAAPVWREEDGRTFVPLRFAPAESVFVVFRRPAGGADHLVSVTRLSPGVPKPPAPRVEIRRGSLALTTQSAGCPTSMRSAAPPSTRSSFSMSLEPRK